MSGTFGAPLARPPIPWNPKYPAEVRDYEWVIPGSIIADPSTIVAMTAEAAPSGTGQLTLNSLVLNAGTVTLNESQGQPGSAYTLRFTFDLADGETIQAGAVQEVLSWLPSDVAVTPTAPGFGPAVSWAAALPMTMQLSARLSAANVALMM